MKRFSNEIAVIVPTYNEKDNVLQLISQIHEHIGDVWIFIVDDSSPDGTQDLVRKYMKLHNDRVRLVTRETKSGRGGAVLEGFAQALKNKNIQYVIEMDADLSHDPSEILRLLERRQSRTLVIGSRYVLGSRIVNWPMRRKVMSNLANKYIRLILGVPINDYTNGYRCYSRKAAELMLKGNIQHKGFISLSEVLYLLYQKSFTCVEVPITFTDRRNGKSNASFFEVVKSLPAILRIKSKYR